MSDEAKIDMQRVIKDELWARLDEVMRPVGSRHELDVSATTLGDWLGDRVFAALFEAGFAAPSAPSEPAAMIDSSEWFGGGCPTCTPVVVPLTVPFSYFEPANDVTLHVNSQGSDGLAFVAVPKREPDGPHVQYGVVMPKDIAAVLARRMLATLEHPAAPSEPVPDGPRVWGGPGCYPPVSSVPDGPRAWAMPVIPSDVKAVHDGDGVTWRRGGEGWIANDDDEDSRGIGEDELIADYGPLTEVVEESTP